MTMGNALIITQLLLQAATQVQQYGAVLAKAQSEGRDVTDEELDELASKDDAARIRLQQHIDTAKGK
jgi:hypothetical protein